MSSPDEMVCFLDVFSTFPSTLHENNTNSYKPASRGLATSDLDPKRCLQRPGDISDLDKESLDVLREWIKKFDEKYPVVGRLRTPHSSKL